jgi:hypothetical protein
MTRTICRRNPWFGNAAEIIKRRHIENCRKEMAERAKATLQAYRAGEFEAATADQIIAELREYYPGGNE